MVTLFIFNQIMLSNKQCDVSMSSVPVYVLFSIKSTFMFLLLLLLLFNQYFNFTSN